MRMGIVVSELIDSIGFSAGPGQIGTLRVKYAADGRVFDYQDVPYAVFRKLATTKHPGEYWLSIRDKFKFNEVKKFVAWLNQVQKRRGVN